MAKLRPLWTPGKPTSARNPSAPSMVSNVPNNAVSWLEDFFNVDFATSGNPSFLVSNITGTGVVRCGSAAASPGILSVASGATSGNVTIVSSSTVAATPSSFVSSTNCLLVVRCAATVTTTGRQGFGFIKNASVAVGTNFLDAPATALTGTSYIAIVRDTGVTPSGGAAGDWCLYASDGAAGDVVLPLGAASTTAVKFELVYTYAGFNADLAVYKDGALVGSVIIVDPTTFNGFRFDFGSQTLTGAARTLNMDLLYYEVALAAAR